MSFLLQVLENTVQGDHAGDGPTWSSRAFSDPRMSCCELSEQISAHTGEQNWAGAE